MNAVIQQLIAWAEGNRSVRAVILTSSRAAPHAEVDIFSDYDVILVVEDIMPFFNDRTWLSEFGPVLVLYRDPLKPVHGLEKFAYITQYENGLKIDFNIWPAALLRRVADAPQLPDELDVSYNVLLDKDGLTAGLKPPTYQAHIPKPPSEMQYLALIEDFFQEATYVAKHLWRADLLAAKYNLDHAMKLLNLYRMFVWRFELDHNWSIKPGDYGRGLKNHISADLWAKLESTYTGAGLEDNWEALFKTISLFREVAAEVGKRLGFVYPHELDRRCVQYLEKVRHLDKQAESVSAALSASESRKGSTG
jgi:aminoglycoside 6-adenylyltransferase